MKNYKLWLAVLALCASVVGCGDDGTDNGGGAGSAGLPGMAGGGAGTTGAAGMSAGTTGGGAGMAGRAGGGAGAGAGMGAAGMSAAGSTGAGAGGASGGAGGSSGGAGGASGGAGGASGAGGSSGGALMLMSSAVANNGMLPAKHRCIGALGGDTGPSPAFTWSGGPAGVMSYAIAMTDTTPGISMGFAHWTIYDIPASVMMLAEGVPEGASPAMPAGAKQAKNQEGLISLPGPGYYGPCGGENTYEFKLYALSVATLPGVGADSTAQQVRTALEANDLATATLTVMSAP